MTDHISVFLQYYRGIRKYPEVRTFCSSQPHHRRNDRCRSRVSSSIITKYPVLIVSKTLLMSIDIARLLSVIDSNDGNMCLNDLLQFPGLIPQYSTDKSKVSDCNYEYIIVEKPHSGNTSNFSSQIKLNSNIGEEVYDYKMKLNYSKQDHKILKILYDLLEEPSTPSSKKAELQKQAHGILSQVGTNTVALGIYTRSNNKENLASLLGMMGMKLPVMTSGDKMDMATMFARDSKGNLDMQKLMMNAFNGDGKDNQDILKLMGMSRVAYIKKKPFITKDKIKQAEENPPAIMRDLLDPRIGCINVQQLCKMFGISNGIDQAGHTNLEKTGALGYRDLSTGERCYEYWRIPPSLWRGMSGIFAGQTPFELAPNFVLDPGMTGKLRAQVIWETRSTRARFNINRWKSFSGGLPEFNNLLNGSEHVTVQMRFVYRSDKMRRHKLRKKGFKSCQMGDRNVRIGRNGIWMKSFNYSIHELFGVLEIEGVISLVKGLDPNEHLVMIKVTPGGGFRYSQPKGCRVRVGPVNKDDERAYQLRRAQERAARRRR